MKKFILVAASVIAAVFVTGCEKDDYSKAPVPPTVNTLKLDLNTFSSSVTKAEPSSADIDSYYTFAANSVMYNWNLIMSKILEIPLNGFETVLKVSPILREDGKWAWESSYKDIIGQTYTTSLLGKEEGDKVNWELHVSKDGLLAYEDFCWLTGWASKDGRNGSWSVKVSPIDTDVIVTSDWVSDGARITDVKLTYGLNHLCHGINPFFNGSYIEYSLGATDPAYDTSVNAHYNHNGIAFWDVNIEWNNKSGAGRIQCKNQFRDSDWHCWTITHTNK